MPALSSNYLLPAILLNPALILHLINTFASHIIPNPTVVSQSPHPIMESLGPVPGSTLYFDMHADDRLCWGYTGVMVVLQVLAIGRVQDNRDRRRAARKARLEKEAGMKEKMDAIASEKRQLGLDGAAGVEPQKYLGNGLQEHPLTGLSENGGFQIENGNGKSGIGSDTSVTETSEEEMM